MACKIYGSVRGIALLIINWTNFIDGGKEANVRQQTMK